MVDQLEIDRTRVLEFVKAYLYIVESNNIEISHKRNTLKSRVKQLSLVYKIPKDFANYLSLFLMVTKFIFVQEKTWQVNYELQDKFNYPSFLQKNLFRFLFFSRDYNEYYKSPLVFNTIYANNDFEIIRKRKHILKTLLLFVNEEQVSFERVYQTLIKRYAFFRSYNDPANYYYTKGEVLSNKQFIFMFLCKTLQYLGVVLIVQKGKTVSDYYLSLTSYGTKLIMDYFRKEHIISKHEVRKEEKRTTESSSKLMYPYKVFLKKANSKNAFNLLFNKVYPKDNRYFSFMSLSNEDLYNAQENNILDGLKQQLIRKLQHENIPNLLV